MQNVPVILTHGFLSNKQFLFMLRHRLKKAGYPVYLTDLSFMCIQDVRILAQQLANRVEQVKQLEQTSHVHIVGVSIGGIIGLYYKKMLEGYEHIHRMVSVGTPFQGTPAAFLGLPMFGLFSKAIWQVLPQNSFLEELVRSPVPHDKITNLIIEGDPICPMSSCHLEGAETATIALPGGVLRHQVMGFSRRVTHAIVEGLEA